MYVYVITYVITLVHYVITLVHYVSMLSYYVVCVLCYVTMCTCMHSIHSPYYTIACIHILLLHVLNSVQMYVIMCVYCHKLSIFAHFWK